MIVSSTNTSSIQIRVKGWKTYYHNSASNGWFVDILYNETTAKCIVNDPKQVSFSTTGTDYLTNCLTDSWIRPQRPISNNFTFTRRLIIYEGSANITKHATENGSGTIYTQFSWEHRGLP